MLRDMQKFLLASLVPAWCRRLPRMTHAAGLHYCRCRICDSARRVRYVGVLLSSLRGQKLCTHVAVRVCQSHRIIDAI